MKIPTTLRHDTLEHALHIFSQAFTNDALQGYINRTHLGLNGSAPITYNHNRQVFSAFLPQMRANGALLLTTKETPTVATAWQVESIPADPIPDKASEGIPDAVHELFGSSMRIFQGKLPPGSPFLHYILAANVKSQAGRISKQEGISFINKEMFNAASQAGLPIIGECTCVNSRDMCLHSGFEQVDEILLGRGIANSTGELVKGGEGFPIFLVLKRP